MSIGRSCNMNTFRENVEEGHLLKCNKSQVESAQRFRDKVGRRLNVRNHSVDQSKLLLQGPQ